MPRSLQIDLGERSYPIHIGRDILSNIPRYVGNLLPSKRVILVADKGLKDAYAKPLLERLRKSDYQVDAVFIPAGEESKSFTAFEQLLNDIMALAPDRKTTLLALGGGVIGDVVGFAASVLLRGVPFVQIPTTLLAQIDSSVGGKTGINSPYGKNTIGAFYQPLAVVIDSATLDSLPEREMKAGYAEMVKYALLGDAEFFTWLEEKGGQVLSREKDALEEAILHCCKMKAKIVAADEREAGKRALLNLGHSFGHALEAEAGYDGSLLHGEAVGVGMLLAAKLSAKKGMIAQDDVARIQAHMEKMGLMILPPAAKVSMPEGVSDALKKAVAGEVLSTLAPEELINLYMAHMRHDKKSENGKITLILLKNVGEAVIEKEVDEAMIRSVWQEVF